MVDPLKHIPLFFLLLLMLTSCSKHVVEQSALHEKPAVAPAIPETTPPKSVTGIIPEALIQKAEKKYGVLARNRYEAFNAKLYELQNSPTEVKLEEINNFFNSVPYGDDTEVWGRKDYWATPLEFLGRDRGDCEDYVIAKYCALRNLGIESEKLYISYARSLRFQTVHMLLSYFETPDSVPLILDNTNYRIFPADQRDDLIHIFNFNPEALYRAGQAGENGRQMLSDGKILNRWRLCSNTRWIFTM